MVNKWVKGYLRNYVVGKTKAWVKWIYLGEYCYNTNHHLSIGMSPFKYLYSYVPLTFFEIVFGNNMDQNQHKLYYDRKRVDHTFEVGELVYLRIQP